VNTARAPTYVLGLVVAVNDDWRLATSYGDLNGSDLFLEPAGLVCSVGLLVGADAVLVLVLTGEAVVVCALLSLQTHVLLLVCVGQTILQHTVDEGLVSELGAGPQVGEVVGGVGHALGSRCDDDVGIAGYDGLGADNEGLNGRGAHLVDGGCDSRLGESSANSTLAGGVLAEAEGLSVESWKFEAAIHTLRRGRCRQRLPRHRWA
jgi:hypothetical protein